MITHLLRLSLAHTLKPFVFKPGPPPEHTPAMKNMGIYIHIPFCKSICDFCPYNKILLERDLLTAYVAALCKEIDLIGAQLNEMRSVQSVYIGGGSPALAHQHLSEILAKVQKHFTIDGHIAIELHPSDITDEIVSSLRNAGVDMVSIGVQTFQDHVLRGLGRQPVDSITAVKRAAGAGFKTVDVDMIFGLPGQDRDILLRDFETAASLGATQISTYPFIRFSYTDQNRRGPGRQTQKKMLISLVEYARNIGFDRSSVWSFTLRGTDQYSSVTRDSFIGFGAGAASLYPQCFAVNTFSVDAYIESLANEILPSALTMTFNERTRALYWLFWSAYNMRVDTDSYRELFGHDISDLFSSALKAGVFLGILEPDGGDYLLTERGAHWFHLVEQKYTHQYIDKTWRTCGANAWPGRITLY